jgi:hypothetical protein
LLLAFTHQLFYFGAKKAAPAKKTAAKKAKKPVKKAAKKSPKK